MKFRIEIFIEYIWKLIPYLRVTFAYVGWSLLWGLLFGFILAAGKVGKNRFLWLVAKVYTAIFRSIPPVVLLFLVYYGVPAVGQSLFGIDLYDKGCLWFVIITVSLLSAASSSEIMRSAYTSVDKGQYEAAVSTGLSELQAQLRIVFPQAIYHAVPSMGNLIIYLIKEGSLGFTIGLVDIFGKANTLNQNTYSNYILEIYVALSCIYWAVSGLIERCLKWLEGYFSIHRTAKE